MFMRPNRESNYGKRGVSYSGPKVWNNIPSQIKQSPVLIVLNMVSRSSLINYRIQKMTLLYIHCTQEADF